MPDFDDDDGDVSLLQSISALGTHFKNVVVNWSAEDLAEFAAHHAETGFDNDEPQVFPTPKI
jgi:hypothetical protein